MDVEEIHFTGFDPILQIGSRCKIAQTLSQPCYIKCGIPQGSNLGPLLFLMYINDLPNCLSSSTASTFADDTNLTTNGKRVEDIQEHLNTDL